MENLLTIKLIKISNFRSIENIDIKNVGGINVFVGPNEAGKSNILKALGWFSNDNEMSDNDIPKAKDVKDDETIVKIIFDIINPKKYLQKLQENIKKVPELAKYLEEGVVSFQEAKYLVIKKQKNGKKNFKFFNNSSEPTEIISVDLETTIGKHIQQRISPLNIDQMTRDGIKEFLVTKELKPQPNPDEVNIIFNHQDIKGAISLMNSQLKPIFDKEIGQIKNIKEIEILKNKLLNHSSKNNISANAYTQNIRNIQIQWNAREIAKVSIESYFRTKLVEPIKKLSLKDIPLIDKLEIPGFTLYSEKLEKIELEGSIKKEELWVKTIAEEKHPLYHRLFKFLNIQPSELEPKNGSTGKQNLYLKNKLREMSEFLDKRWTQKKIKFDSHLTESELSIYIVDLDKKRREILSTFPEDRSDGFQWFLGYFITLNYIKESETIQILLLDDPALHLHPKGQKNFLEELEDLSKNNQIFYSTHLVSLFSEDHLDRIYLVESENSKTKIEKPWANEHKDVMEPVRRALGLDIIIFRDTEKIKILFVEGMADKFIIESILYIKGKLENWYVYPMFGGNGIGENKIIKKIKLMQCISELLNEKNFWYVLDGDKRKIIENNKKIDGETKRHITFMGNQNQELEDLLDKKFYLECIKEVYYPLFIENKTKIVELNKVCSTTDKKTEGKITKFLENEFQKNNLGGFAKVEVAKCIKRKLLTESKNIKYLRHIEKKLKK